VYDVFARYCAGEVSKLPWNDSALALETGLIRDELIRMNKHGFLTINSQPRVNGAPSDDPKVGWGPKGGYVFQKVIINKKRKKRKAFLCSFWNSFCFNNNKAYVEFFVSPENLQSLIEATKNFPSITYYALNMAGTKYTNGPDNATAVTWGVFPNSEILQPTVVDPASFIVWKVSLFLSFSLSLFFE
jgi:methylenetetrahydrofolate reductase (NADPH)